MSGWRPLTQQHLQAEQQLQERLAAMQYQSVLVELQRRLDDKNRVAATQQQQLLKFHTFNGATCRFACEPLLPKHVRSDAKPFIRKWPQASKQPPVVTLIVALNQDSHFLHQHQKHGR